MPSPNGEPTSTAVQEAAAALETARHTRVPVQQVSRTWPQLDLDAAYQVQLEGVRRRLAAGERVVGHKVGLTAKVMQQMFGVDQPDYGHLTDRMLVPDGAAVPCATYLQPRAEIEVAFVLAAPLKGPGVTPEDVLTATEGVCAAIEIIDSRIADWQITLVDTVADNGSSAAAVLGQRRLAPDQVDLAAVDGRVLVNGEEAGRGRGDAVLGHPATAVAWLANALGDRGITLEPGHVVLSGAIAAAVPVHPGTRVTARFDTLGEATVEFT